MYDVAAVVKRLNVSLNLFVIDVARHNKLFLFVHHFYFVENHLMLLMIFISSSSIFNVFNLIPSKSNSFSSFLSNTISSLSLKLISFSIFDSSPINVHSFKPFSIKS